MKIVAGTAASTLAIATGQTAATTGAATAGGIGAGTLIGIGAGVAAIGSVAAVVASTSGDEDGGDGSIDWDTPFTGIFIRDISGSAGNLADNCTPFISTFRLADTFQLVQNGMSLSGSYSAMLTFGDCCSDTDNMLLSGMIIDRTTATINFGIPSFSCDGTACHYEDTFGGGAPLTLAL